MVCWGTGVGKGVLLEQRENYTLAFARAGSN
jgi:hypothetical protein